MKATRILAAGAAATALLMDPTASSTPTASADGCPDVEVVFARGTSEPPGLGRVGDGLVNALRNQTSRSVGAYAVNYPASYDFGRAADGANDASGHIMWMVENCPGTRLVLGGYSQGAAIIDIVAAAPVPGFGFTAPLPPEAADHVAAIAVFGNPSNKIGQPLTNSPAYGFKTIDLCTDGDPVCSPGRIFSAHSGYTPGMTNQAASFVAGLL
ncbi:cutinase family protein [Mycolicibacter heraklionensis]|uniref:Cutinase n=1 Tax=Mycolicibacter virginiensis TaxID=1795032 RepID=A0A9X7IRL2_9MYCO|nr:MULTISPECIES: cutinase family protein [Mycobacteriaceae]OBG37077.1 cutinase [Mycolicibacter heraklionensis]OBJ31222.1 cutinase [Mycolicibacter heraklionensis]PQM54096.1 cutinase family protein [Mycolicibacter virginiensis]